MSATRRAVVTLNNDVSGKITVAFRYNPQLVEKVKSDGGVKSGLLSQQPVIAMPTLRQKQSQKTTNLPSPLVGEGKGEGGFEDIRKELLSRKYSYKTVKVYIYYNRDFLNFTGKQPYNINDSDIKDYLLYPRTYSKCGVYLAEEKQSATSTLNQAINALKFYY